MTVSEFLQRLLAVWDESAIRVNVSAPNVTPIIHVHHFLLRSEGCGADVLPACLLMMSYVNTVSWDFAFHLLRNVVVLVCFSFD